MLLYYIGEVVLYLLTFGRRKPRWDEPDFEFYPRDRRTWVSVIVGILFLIPILLASAIVMFFWVEAFG